MLRTLGRWYDVTFRVTDPRAYDYYFTLTTHDSSLREILSELQRIAPMRFTREGETIVIGMETIFFTSGRILFARSRVNYSEDTGTGFPIPPEKLLTTTLNYHS